MHLLLHLLLVVSHKRTKCFPCCTWSPSFPRVEISASSPSQAKEQDDDTKPLWTYVTKIKSGGGGGNYEIKCNICDVTFNGSYTRVGAHLLKIIRKRVRGCQKITNAKLIDLKKIDNEATLRVEKSKTKFVIASVHPLHLGSDYLFIIESRAREWLFYSEGQWMVVRSSKAARLIMLPSKSVTLGLLGCRPLHSDTSMEEIQKDLSPLVTQLAPTENDNGAKIPFMMASEGIKERNIIHKSESLLIDEQSPTKLVSETGTKKNNASSKSRKSGSQRQFWSKQPVDYLSWLRS
ncbi:hypothetical protein JHK87_016420 [Glycine soja]|nr:hypothetical protein JHK87_016420 [Glycine soja]